MKLRPDKNQTRWGVTVFITGIALMLAFVLFFKRASISAWILQLMGMLRSIIAGVVIAYVLCPVLNVIEKRILVPIYEKRGTDVSLNGDQKRRKRMRGISVAMTIIFFLLVLYALIMILVPQLIKSITEIVNNVPGYIDNINGSANLLLADNPMIRETVENALDTSAETFAGFLKDHLVPNLSTVVDFIRKSITQVVNIFINLLVGTIVAVYLLNSKEMYIGQLKKFTYAFLKSEAANELIAGFRFIHRTFTGFILGKVVDSVIIGVICFMGSKILAIPYPVLISVAVGLTNIIPFFGPYIGAIFGAILLVMIDPIKALVFLIFVIILQQFDGNILGPLILGNSTGLSSFWVIFSIMLFGGFWGPVGWILGVPVFACIYAFVAYMARGFLKKKGLPEDAVDYIDAAYVEDGKLLSLSEIDRSTDRYNVKQQGSAWRRIFKMYKKSKRLIKGVNPLSPKSEERNLDQETASIETGGEKDGKEGT